MKRTLGISLILGFLGLVIMPLHIHSSAATGRAGTFAGTVTEKDALPVCSCTSRFNAKTPILTAGKASVRGGTRYGFEPNVVTSCTGSHCSISSITYSWTATGAGGAAFTIVGNITNAKKVELDLTAAGDVTLSCTVTVTCSDGTTCTDIGSKTFSLKP